MLNKRSSKTKSNSKQNRQKTWNTVRQKNTFFKIISRKCRPT